MPDQLLTFLKYIFLALLYLFFLRVLRAVWMELREPKAAPVGAPVGSAHVAAAGPGASLSGTPAPMAGPVDAPTRTGAPFGGPGGAGQLVILEPATHRNQRFALAGELTVGRAAGCGVAIPDDTFVSQLHARIFRRDGDLYVEDLGSTNGTYLNDGKVTGPTPMHEGDKLQIGRTIMEIRP